MNAPDMATICKCDRLIRFKIDGSTIRTYLTFANIVVLKYTAEQILWQLTVWFQNNKLTLNTDKTQFSIFKKGNVNSPQEYTNLKFDGNIVKRVEQAVYLGVILDDKLNWKRHITALTNKFVKYASSFKLTSRLVPNICKRQPYFAYSWVSHYYFTWWQ